MNAGAACWSPDGKWLAVGEGNVLDPRPGVGLGFLSDRKGERLEVRGVLDGSGAADAGIRAGDLVESADGVNIADPTQFARVLQPKRAGDRVRVVLFRGAERREVAVELREFAKMYRPGRLQMQSSCLQ